MSVLARRPLRHSVQHPRRRTGWMLLAGLTCVSLSLTATAADPDDAFSHRVMAVLSRAGCNLGSCHGNLNGKGGLSLSLRGEDPWRDYLALTHDLAGRRLNRASPDESLMLLKPTAIVPHQGGQRIKLGSREYRILRDWIGQGAPRPSADAPTVARIEIDPKGLVVRPSDTPVVISAVAEMTDGQRINVTELATYEASNFVASVSPNGVVTPLTSGEVTVSVRYLNQQVSVRAAFVPSESWTESTSQRASPSQANWVDEFIVRKLQQLGLKARPTAADHVFLRRAHLDVVGQLPAAAEAIEFVRDPRPDKRLRLIDRLLADPRFADRWAMVWSDLLRNEEKLLDRTGVEVFHEWIRKAFADGVPLNQFVAQLVAARGSTYENPPANFYRALRDPLTRGESVAQLFLGVRLQCAKCHNHPFDHWTQDDYYAWAGLFARVDYEIVENNRKDRLDKSEFVGEQRVIVKDEGEVTNARTAQAASPRFLTTSQSEPTPDPDADRLQQLAGWLASTDNVEFARAQVNRIWYHLMGRGLVDPIDDFRVTNPASHPALLDRLASEFVRSNYDVRHLVRTIMLSDAYQTATVSDDLDALAPTNYAGVAPRRLTAEQLLDAQCRVLDTVAEFNGYVAGTTAGQLAGVERVRRRDQQPSEDDRFLTMFGKPSRQMSCECERSDDTTLAQAFYLINGAGLQRRLSAANNQLAAWAAAQVENHTIVDQLYWRALSRPPTVEERTTAIDYLATAESRVEAMRDLSWALLNAKEFLFRY